MENCIAHKKGLVAETIREHGLKTVSYGKSYNESTKLTTKFSKLLIKIIGNNILEMNMKRINKEYLNNIDDVLLYHDYGKINTYFQRSINGHKGISSISREHSIGSSVIYLYEKLKGLENSDLTPVEKSYLEVFIVLNSWVISRHHGKFNNYVDYVERMSDYLRGSKIQTLSNYINFDEMLIFFSQRNYFNSGNKFSKFNRLYEDFIGDEYTLRILLFLYTKLVFGLLCQSDYLATSEFMLGSPVNLSEDKFNVSKNKVTYDNSAIVKSITDNRKNHNLDALNRLRLKVLDESISTYTTNLKGSSYLLEAMTGIGKTNISIDLGLRIMEDSNLQKLIYVFPYNSIVDQTQSFMKVNLGVSGEVINSCTEIEVDSKIKVIETNNESQLEEDDVYNAVYLDRLMLNVKDGTLLTSHVNFSNMLFGTSKNSAINLINLTDSLVIMDEIHAYTPNVWELFVKGLEIYKDILGLELVYMSATMPNFSRYINVKRLVPNFSSYTNNDIYKNKYEIKGDLLYKNKDQVFFGLLTLLLENKDKKNLVSFITRRDANEFYNFIKDSVDTDNLYLVTSDVSKRNRLSIIEAINQKSACIVIATQVIEVGVDIDMDIGYGNVRPVASLEQLVGRINRNNKKVGCKFYLFNIANPEGLYKDDYIQHPEKMMSIMKTRDYTCEYYDKLQDMKAIEGLFNKGSVELSNLEYSDFSDSMVLIEDTSVNVYILEDQIAKSLWEEYCEAYTTVSGFGERKVKLHNLRVRLNDYTCSVPESYVKKYNFEGSYENGYYVLTDKVWLTK